MAAESSVAGYLWLLVGLLAGIALGFAGAVFLSRRQGSVARAAESPPVPAKGGHGRWIADAGPR